VVDDTVPKDSIERVRVGPEITDETPYDPEYYVKLIEADYLELTYDAQIQAHGRVKYSASGVERTLDDWELEDKEVESSVSANQLEYYFG
ncbi:MAG: hypothetical protein ACXAE3_10050, partial [Candidatus Kariarchaeaceae archaeon]|jgi:hypothetical protein